MSHQEPTRYAVTIMRSPTDVYQAWRRWEDMPLYSRHLKQVEDLGNGRTRWTAEGPTGDVTWEAETIEDVPGERISWRSVADADVKNAGSVEFKEAPGGRGTELYVSLEYQAPGGIFGVMAAKATGNEPEQEIAEHMRRFKSILECGEIPIIEGQPSHQMRGESQPGDMSKKVGLR